MKIIIMYSLEARNHDPLVCVYCYVLSWVATIGDLILVNKSRIAESSNSCSLL